MSFPKTLNLRKCNCEYDGKTNFCKRSGFLQGHFPQGAGFDNELAKEIKRRWDLVESMEGANGLQDGKP